MMQRQLVGGAVDAMVGGVSNSNLLCVFFVHCSLFGISLSLSRGVALACLLASSLALKFLEERGR